MLSNEEFLQWCGRLSLSKEAQAVITTIRSASPARRVGGGRQNVSGRYPSRKMGVTIQFESHRVELAFVYEMEHDADVLEYYDQAPAIPLEYESANARRLAVMHTPDYFVIHKGSAGWQECKQERELKDLSEKSPNRYVKGTGDGGVRPEQLMPNGLGSTIDSDPRQRSIGRSNAICSIWKIIGALKPTFRTPSAGNVWEFMDDEWQPYKAGSSKNPIAGGQFFESGKGF